MDLVGCIQTKINDLLKFSFMSHIHIRLIALLLYFLKPLFAIESTCNMSTEEGLYS